MKEKREYFKCPECDMKKAYLLNFVTGIDLKGNDVFYDQLKCDNCGHKWWY